MVNLLSDCSISIFHTPFGILGTVWYLNINQVARLYGCTLLFEILPKNVKLWSLAIESAKKIMFSPCIVKINGFRILTDWERHNAHKTANKNA